MPPVSEQHEDSMAVVSRFGRSEILTPLLTAVIAGALLGITSFALPSPIHPVCIEGGEYAGFPVAFYIRCYGPVIPGDGQAKDEPEFRAAFLAVDSACWFVVAAVTLGMLRRGFRILHK